MPSQTEAATAALILIQQQAGARERVTENLRRLVRLYLRAFRGWYDERQVRAVSAQLAQTVRQAQVVTADLTAEYLIRVLDVYEVPTQRRPVVLPAQPRGVDPTDVWERPAKEFRYQRSQGADGAAALERATRRAELIAEDDLMLAMREGAAAALDFPDSLGATVGYRRIIHPELSKDGSCGLCVVAADRIYQNVRKFAIHERCKCTVLPVTEELDPGLSLNAADLRRLYAAAGGTTAAAALKRVRVAVHEHGELGAVLRRADWDFRDQDAATADLRSS